MALLAPDHPKKKQDGVPPMMRLHQWGCPRRHTLDGACWCDDTAEMVDVGWGLTTWARPMPNKGKHRAKKGGG